MRTNSPIGDSPSRDAPRWHVRRKFVLGLGAALGVLALLLGLLLSFGRERAGFPDPGSSGPGLPHASTIQHWRAKRCSQAPAAAMEVEPRREFLLRCRESAQLKQAALLLTVEDVDYSPMQAVGGVEVWPYSLFDLSVRCGTITERRKAVTKRTEACGYQIQIVKIDGEDDATFILDPKH